MPQRNKRSTESITSAVGKTGLAPLLSEVDGEDAGKTVNGSATTSVSSYAVWLFVNGYL